jgi:hypothetical protein
MSAIDNTPENKNFLSPLNFRFLIKKAPHVNFFIQQVNIPSMTLQSPGPNNPFVRTPIPGEHLTFGDLRISFKVDEDLQNYLEIHNWLKGLGKPENFNQYKEIQDKPSYTGDGIYSDISLLILSSTKMPNYEITYTDSFPVSLSDLVFRTTDENVKYITADAVFKYTYYTITNI